VQKHFLQVGTNVLRLKTASIFYKHLAQARF